MEPIHLFPEIIHGVDPLHILHPVVKPCCIGARGANQEVDQEITGVLVFYDFHFSSADIICHLVMEFTKEVVG